MRGKALVPIWRIASAALARTSGSSASKFRSQAPNVPPCQAGSRSGTAKRGRKRPARRVRGARLRLACAVCFAWADHGRGWKRIQSISEDVALGTDIWSAGAKEVAQAMGTEETTATLTKHPMCNIQHPKPKTAARRRGWRNVIWISLPD